VLWSIKAKLQNNEHLFSMQINTVVITIVKYNLRTNIAYYIRKKTEEYQKFAEDHKHTSLSLKVVSNIQTQRLFFISLCIGNKRTFSIVQMNFIKTGTCKARNRMSI